MTHFTLRTNLSTDPSGPTGQPSLAQSSLLPQAEGSGWSYIGGQELRELRGCTHGNKASHPPKLGERLSQNLNTILTSFMK